MGQSAAKDHEKQDNNLFDIIEKKSAWDIKT